MKNRNILLPVIFLLCSTFGTLTFSCNRKENYKVINNIAMNENQFWNLIENTKSRSSNDYQRQVLLLEELLSTNDVDPVEFNTFFQELINKAYDWKLWAASYIINGGCSDDCFMDFRSWLIGQGKETFYKILEDPEILSDMPVEPDNWEGLQYAAEKAFLKKTGSHLPIYTGVIKKEPSGVRWEEEDLAKILPKLFVKYSDR